MVTCRGHLDIVQVLLGARADASLVGGQGSTPCASLSRIASCIFWFLFGGHKLGEALLLRRLMLLKLLNNVCP